MAAIDRHDCLLAFGGLPAEAVAGEHHQRGADYQQRIRLGQALAGAFHPRFGHRLTEKHHRRFEQPAAARATRHTKRAKIRLLQIGVAVRPECRDLCHKGRIVPFQRGLEGGACLPVTAGKAIDRVQASVQIDDAPAAGLLVQAVNILRDPLVDEAGGFQPCQGNMDSVGPGAGKGRPAEQTARPIALAGILAADKGLVVDRRLAFPVAIAVAVIGNTRCGAATGTGQDK